MEILPAIYILDGRCVALYKGSYEQKATYTRSPIHMARFFEKEGARKIHIVDFNSRREGNIQKELLQHLLIEIKIPIQLEATFSSIPAIKEILDLGISAVILRPRALNIIQEAIQIFGPEKILVEIQSNISGIDFEDAKEKPIPDIVDFAEKLVSLGVKNIIYKDERSEGTMIHPNYDEIDRLVLVTGKNLNIYNASGIGELKHLELLKKIGATGAIIGKALYEGHFSLKEAMRVGEGA